MMAQANPRPPKTRAGEDQAGGAWVLTIARWLGQSSRFAADEANHLVKVARDTIVCGLQPDESPRGRVRAGPSANALVKELAQLVAQNDSASLEGDKRFWCLVRELYSRRPWVPRKSRDLVDTIGIEVKEHTAPSHMASAKTTTANGSTAEPDAERTAK